MVREIKMPHDWFGCVFVIFLNVASHNSSICSDEGLTLETSAFQSLYGGQFTLSTPLINQIFVFHSPTDAAPQFFQKLTPLSPVIDYHLIWGGGWGLAILILASCYRNWVKVCESGNPVAHVQCYLYLYLTPRVNSGVL